MLVSFVGKFFTEEYSSLKRRVKYAIVLAIVLTILYIIVRTGYNMIAYSLGFGLIMLLIYGDLIKKDVKMVSVISMAFKIWLIIVIMFYLGIAYGYLHAIIYKEESLELLKEVGEQILPLGSPIEIFLFNISKGILGVIPFFGPFIIGVALGNSGFIIGVALMKLIDAGLYRNFLLVILTPLHPYGILELFSYGLFLSSSLYLKRKMFKKAIKTTIIASILLFIAAYIEYWEIQILSSGI